MSLNSGTVSFGNSSSSGGSYIPSYGEEPFLNQLAQLMQSLGQQQYQWAQGEFGKNSQLTDQAVQNYLSASQQAMALAGNNYDRYTQIFQPQENNLIADANTYSSPDRVKAEMGQAMAGVASTADANRQNAERQLQSFGVDPSSGRYAELEQAAATQRGATQAAAGLAARQNTEATGRQLRGQAIQVGQQYPGQVVNELNSAYQGLSGAVNSRLANTNTGVNAFNGAKGFLDTASQLKYPPLGNRQSSSQNTGSSGGVGGGSGQGGGSRGGGSGGGRGGYGGGGGDGYPGYDPNLAIPGTSDAGFPQSVGGPPGAGGDPNSDWGYGDSDPYGNAQGDQGAGYDASSDYGWGNSDPYGGNGGDYSAQDTGGSGYSDTGGYDNSGYNDANYDEAGGYSDTGGYDFAAGGAIPEGPTTGGYADPTLSPSGGQQTDDIPAHLNANEFVIPRDVAMWKGQEFFQKLIDQSRKARQGASAQGQPSNKPVGQPAFVSSGA